MQMVIFSFSCPVTSTNTPSLPLLFSPSWLSNKAMGHISEAFRGSLAHPLVSPNHNCNREPNLYRDFYQTQTAGSSRSRGRMIQLPQRHQAKTDIKLKIKGLVTAQWHGKSAYEFWCERTVCQKWSARFLFTGQNVAFPPLSFSSFISNPASTSAGSQSPRRRAASEAVVWLAADIWGWQLTEKRDTLLETGWQVDVCSPVSPPTSGKMNRPPHLSVETEEFSARSQWQNAYGRICSTPIVEKWALMSPLVANPGSVGRCCAGRVGLQLSVALVKTMTKAPVLGATDIWPKSR